MSAKNPFNVVKATEYSDLEIQQYWVDYKTTDKSNSLDMKLHPQELNAENTEFSKNVQNPESICGFSALSDTPGGDEILIVSSGYNDELINIVSRDKEKSKRKIFITGFPSLQADMYQQSLIQLNKCKETIGSKELLRAPAYDPFSTAQKIQDAIDKIRRDNSNISYIHLAPLSTKPHAIAMALVYLNNPDLPINILYPRSDSYTLSHADGIKRTWLYSLELP